MVDRDSPRGRLDRMTSRHTLSRPDFLRLLGAGAAATVIPGTLAACGRENADGQSLRIMSLSDAQDTMPVMVNGYQEANPGVELEVGFVGGDEYYAVIRTQLTSGTAPDILTVNTGTGDPSSVIDLAAQNRLADLSDQPWVARLSEGFRSTVGAGGNAYALPMTNTLLGAIYNEAVFEELGLAIPETWEEFLTICEAIKSSGKHPLALGIQTQWVTQLIPFALVSSTVYAENPEFDEQMQAGNATFADSGWRDALEKQMELHIRGYFNPSPLGITFEQSLQMVASGEAAMVVQTSSVLAQLESYNENGSFKMFAVPAVNDPSKVRITTQAGQAWSANAESAHLETAKDFIRFLGEPENMNKYAEIGGTLPAIRDDQTTVSPALEPMIPYLDSGRAVPYFMNQVWPNPDTLAVFYTVGQQLFSEDLAIDQALLAMDESYLAG